MSTQRDKLIKSCKEKLLQQREELVAKINSVEEDLKGQEKSADVNDVSSNVEMLSSSLRLNHHHHATLNQIEASLKAIESGDYGYCEDCGDEIDGKRLEAFPTASLCIDCKSKSESLGRLHGQPQFA